MRHVRRRKGTIDAPQRGPHPVGYQVWIQTGAGGYRKSPSVTWVEFHQNAAFALASAGPTGGSCLHT